MLTEIINFMKSLSEENLKRGVTLDSGLYITTQTDNNKLEIVNKLFYKKGEEITNFLNNYLLLKNYTICVSARKKLDNPEKLNYSCSPFCLIYGVEKFKKLLTLDIDAYFKKLFNNAISFCISKDQKEYAEKFLKSINRIFLNNITNFEEYKSLRSNDYICIFYENASLDDYMETYNKYLAQKVFNDEQYNKTINGEVYGVSDYLSGYNQKKPFLKHKTASFSINNRLSGDNALYLFRFLQFQLNNVLPNPLPIFIEKKELNNEVVKIFNRDENRKVGFAEIIYEVYERDNDLGNYYLFNFFGKNVNDFDFVTSFQYNFVPPLLIEDLFDIQNGKSIVINNIFEFEKIIMQKIFENQLIQKTKDNIIRLRYFDEIKYNPLYIRAKMYHLVITYRKAFYDFIYKSKKHVITKNMFDIIMITGIIDNINEDKYNDRKHTKEFSIKEKLNIWFSLYNFFDIQQTNKGVLNMANMIKDFQIRMQQLITEKDIHIENDQEFAYASGQLIYYLLNCSESSNKTHALLEPFLQKTDLIQFKLAISRTFNQFKHAIKFYKGRFEKLMSEILSYNIECNLKDLLPIILAGYFAENVIYKKLD